MNRGFTYAGCLLALIFMGCGETSSEPTPGSEANEAATENAANEPTNRGSGSVEPQGEGANGAGTTESAQPEVLEEPPTPVAEPSPSQEGGTETPSETPADPAARFVLRLEQGEFNAEMAQVQVHLDVEPADADLTRKGVRTALLELEYPSSLALPEPFNLTVVAGPAAPGVNVRTVVEAGDDEGSSVVRAMLVNWNDTLMKPGHIASISFRRQGEGPYAFKWKTGAQSTEVTPPEANNGLKLDDAVFDFTVE